ncbi:general substrate transporter [Dipodascopsis tothii]|uniref:general substrate transporter n=1 Tax=Dipodascopsis tothii TaxID=44089 RepID=UPI0034CF3CA9
MGSPEVIEDQNVVEAQVKESEIVVSKKSKVASYISIACSGAALISDGYQNNLMTMMNVLFALAYKTEYNSTMKTRVSNALLVGEVLGQVSIGLVCDYLGRKFALVSTTLLIVIGGILAAAAHGSTPTGMFWMITVCRGIIGFGAGGEYPASSTSASEAANEATPKRRGPTFIMVTNLPLSLGGPVAISIFLIVLSAAGQNHLSTVWRVCFAIGCIFPLSVFWFRLRMMTSKLYHEGAIKKNVPYGLTIKYYWKSLVGTCGAWFLYDFVTFPNGVFSGAIISSIVPDSATNLKKTAEWNLLLGMISIPGVFIGAFLCDRIGRKNTMMLGFSGYLVFGLIIGIAYEKMSTILPLFIVFYGLFNCCGNLGPGDMLGLLSSECYATAVRGTCYGLSAAIGKTGAAIGTQCFTPIQSHLGKKWTFIIAALCGVVGVAVTFFFVPNVTGEDLGVEDKKFHDYLTANGWQGTYGEDSSSFEEDEKSSVKTEL